MKRPIKFLWAAAHTITDEQAEELNNYEDVFHKSTGITMLQDINPELLNKMINTNISTDLSAIAVELLSFCKMAGYVLVQPMGSPKFQFKLGVRNTVGYEFANDLSFNVKVMYAFSERISEDIPQKDGSIKKVSTFKHICFH